MTTVTTDLAAATTRQSGQRHVGAALGAAGIAEAAHEARRLVCAAADIDHVAFLRDPDAPLGAAAVGRLRAMLARRLAREPLSRILGHRGFWSLDVLVGPGVLDPRADSETLIEAALDLMGSRRSEPLRILDLGTGSGALLCALLAEFPAASGLGIDRSAAACALAAANVSRCGLADRGSILERDWHGELTGRFDLVVANPPYVATAEIAALDVDVRDYDPHTALDGGTDGLDAYRSLSGTLPRLIAAGGCAIVEIGSGQAPQVTSLMRSAGLALAATRHDSAGHARAIVLRR